MQLRYPTLWRIAVLLLYLFLTCYQLGLPGLHYDEAKEAGVNAMELLTNTTVTAFRGATLSLFGKQLPLMVQDYIGALSVYLALPFLKLTGIGVPNLRILSVLTGLATLLLLEQVMVEWLKWAEEETRRQGDKGIQSSKQKTTHHAPRTTHYAPLIAITLLAVSPSFIFWNRQGIFVTNLTQPLVLWAMWQGLRWLRLGRNGSLAQAAFASGLAIYAKLLAIWVLIPFLGMVVVFWIVREMGWGGEGGRQGDRVTGWQDEVRQQSFALRTTHYALLALPCFLLALSPFLLFNWQTGGTFSSVGGNLTQSYYGVNNLDIAHNFWVRFGQLGQVLRGDQFDYLGGTFSNWLAPWLALITIAFGTLRNWRMILAPIALLIAAFAASLFTVSGLFVTHYALLQPILFGVVGIAIIAIRNTKYEIRSSSGNIPHSALRILLLLWLCFDLTNSIRYHQVLAQSGGLGDHSDASYHLAYYLRYNGLGAPIALDWGMEATVRYLSEGTVQPIEIFGYGSISEPDAAFAEQLTPFLQNPDNVYLLRAPNRTVFAGRREQFLQQVQHLGLTATLETTFSQRNGEALFELWRVH